MTAVQSQIDSYFSSISSVAKKITQDCDSYKQKYGEGWGGLSTDQQDKLLDDFIIDPKVAEKYTPLDEEDLPNCFPKYRINCGEKIIVDFDHDDGWTWQDEHSGPFSWKTKSQQDLTLDDIDELANEPAEGTKRHRMLRKSRSPERMDPSAGQGDTNEVEQIFQKFGITFHNKDDESCDEAENDAKDTSQESNTTEESSVYTSAQASSTQAYTSTRGYSTQGRQGYSTQGREGYSTQGREGYSTQGREGYSTQGREGYSTQGREGYSTQGREGYSTQGREGYTSQSYTYEEPPEENVHSSGSVSFSREGSVSHSDFEDYHGRETLDRTQSSRSSSTMSSNMSSAMSSNSSRKKGSGKGKVKKSRPEAEQSLLADLSISLGKHRESEDIGQVSPVFIEDPGESCTDVIGTTYKFPIPLHDELSPRHTTTIMDTTHTSVSSRSRVSQEVTVEEEWSSEFLSSDNTIATDTAPKTGFDFLDNW